MRVLIFLFAIGLWQTPATACSCDDGEGINGEAIAIVALVTYSTINLVPAAFEYNRHDPAETSFGAIYATGFVGGIAGLLLGDNLAKQTSVISEGKMIVGGMVLGMVLGNRYGHYEYTRYKLKNVSLYPAITQNNVSLGLSFDY